MPQGVKDEGPYLVRGASRPTNGTFEKSDSIRQGHGVSVASPVEGNAFVESKQSVSSWDSALSKLLPGWFILDEHGHVFEAIPERFWDGLPGLVDQCFELGVGHMATRRIEPAF